MTLLVAFIFSACGGPEVAVLDEPEPVQEETVPLEDETVLPGETIPLEPEPENEYPPPVDGALKE